MPKTPQQQKLEWIRSRMAVIVESATYSSHEKRIRAISQIEILLETVMESLPPEQQRLIQEVLKLYEQAWSKE